jgi:hypothetical protein
MSSVFTEVPILYDATFVRARHHKPETAGLVIRVPVEIKSVSAAEAPVAAVAQVHQEGASYEVTYREFNGRLMRPHGSGGHGYMSDSKPSTLVTVDNLAAHMESLERQFLRGDLWKWIFTRDFREGAYGSRHMENIYREDDVPIKEFVKDDRAAMIASVQQAFDNMVVVDGVLYVPSEGPVWSLRFNEKTVAAELHCEFLFNHSLSHVAPINNPLAFMEQRVKGDYRIIPEIKGSVEILRPDLFDRIEESRFTRLATEGITDHATRMTTRLRQFTGEELLNFSKLKKAVEDIRAHRPVDYTQLRRDLEQFGHGAWEKVEENARVFGDFHEYTLLMEHLEEFPTVSQTFERRM